jgi:galactose mutarotase-like enzyme
VARDRPFLLVGMSLLGLAATAATAAEEAGTCPDKAPADLVALDSPDGTLTATIAPGRGGEMVSLRLLQGKERRELLYRGRNFCEAGGFDGKAPVLWPATGRTYLPDTPGQKPQRGWLWKGKTYDMPVHGFARDLPWRVVAQKRDGMEASLTLELVDTPETRKRYPFGFAFQLRYVLRGSTVSVEHRIRADKDNRAAMPFSLGNHIAFALPPGGAALTTPATRRLLLDGQARPTGKAEEITPPKDSSLAPFSAGPAVPLAGYGQPAMMRLDFADGLSITVDHRGSKLPAGEPVGFNMWGDLKKGFFSPEPWWGKQNALATGDGLVELAPGATFEWTFRAGISSHATERK